MESVATAKSVSMRMAKLNRGQENVGGSIDKGTATKRPCASSRTILRSAKAQKTNVKRIHQLGPSTDLT